jgi:hypothetical protein
MLCLRRDELLFDDRPIDSLAHAWCATSRTGLVCGRFRWWVAASFLARRNRSAVVDDALQGTEQPARAPRDA